MSETLVSETQRPAPHPFYGDSWERGKDPWHADAFKGLEGELGQNPGTTGERKGGWFLIDGHGNTIGFVPDGSPVSAAPPSHDLIVTAPSGNRRELNG